MHLGFSTQETVLAHRLLEAPRGSTLSLEVIDDVGIHLPDATQTAVQSKSALVTNPISDHAIGLWKTLANWLQLLSDGVVELDRTTFILYVSTQANGAIAKAFGAAANVQQAGQAIADAKATMWGSAPQFRKRQAMAADLAKYVNPVLQDPRLPELLTHFRVEFGSGSPIADLENELEKQFLAEGFLNELCERILGWVKKNIALLLEQQKPAVVSRDEFHAAMNAYLRRTRVQNILLSYAKAPTLEQQKAELSRLFVRQLGLIELEEDDFLAAVSDFLRAAVDRVQWAKEGLIHENSFDEFDAALQAAWGNNRIGARAQHPSAPVRHGQHLYAACMNYQMPLQGIETPTGFVRGCFHTLADSLTVGWHPDYKKLLAETDDTE